MSTVRLDKGLFALSPFMFAGLTPRPLAFRLRGQDPLLILALGGLQWARGSGRLFLVSVPSGLLPFLSSLCCCSCCSPVVVGPVSGVARFLVALFLFLLCCRVFCVCFFCLGCAWGVLSFVIVVC